MKLKCKKDVVVEGNQKEVAFIQGKEYHSRKTVIPKNVIDVEGVERAKNEQGKMHIIKSDDSDELDDFFYTHFDILN